MYGLTGNPDDLIEEGRPIIDNDLFGEGLYNGSFDSRLGGFAGGGSQNYNEIDPDNPLGESDDVVNGNNNMGGEEGEEDVE